MPFQQYPQKLGVPSGNTAGRPTNPVIGDTYYNGELEIIEIYNGTAWVAMSAPAATPSIVSVTDASTTDAYTSTAGKLTVVLQAGVGGSTPSQFNAFTTAGGHSAFSSSSTVTLTGLTPGTGYTVYANAQNNFGTTVNTPNFAEVTPTTLPQVRTIGTASTSSVTTDVTVTWTNGNNGGKNLTSITITPFLNGTTAQTSQTAATTSSTTHTFTGLSSGSAYTFKVKATNANGTCADSTATNSVTVPSFVTVDYLVVAGGGAGNYSTANGGTGGGGAGGLRSTVTNTGGLGTLETALTVSKSNNYTVTVGAGGASVQSSSYYPGENSVFASITSTGGGGGGAGQPGGTGGGGPGGSGGGAGENNTSPGTRTASPVQGFDGGSGATGSDGHGGGGAGAVGVNGTNNVRAGNGGAGVAVSITGSSVTYAGGGGGSSYSYIGGDGGTGGGGNGTGPSNRTSGTAGAANTGGGGGSIGGSRGYGGSSAGGSGVVILRWLTSAASITVGAGLTADSTGTDGSYSYKRFTAGSGNVSFS